MISGILPPALYSSAKVFGVSLNVATTSPFFSIFPSNGYTSMISPVSRFDTSTSIGSAPLSSAVLKKIGAIVLPKISPPVFLFGTNGISRPIHH